MAKKKVADPARLTCAELGRLLSQATIEPVTERAIRDDLKAGAPVNEDGTIHLLHYTAWLVTQSK